MGEGDLSLSTSNTYLQNYACYNISDATITSTNSVSETLTLFTGSANCSSAQIRAGKVHAFRSTTKLSSNSMPSISIASFGLFGFLLALFVVGRSHQFRNLCCLLVLTALGFGLAGCGGSGSTSSSSAKSFSLSVSPSTVTVSAGTSGIPTGSYSITIIGTDSSSSSETASTTMTLTIS